MKRPYFTPKLVEYGNLARVTGVVGGASDGDVFLSPNGNTVITGTESIDACAQDGGKCKCADNGTC